MSRGLKKAMAPATKSAEGPPNSISVADPIVATELGSVSLKRKAEDLDDSTTASEPGRKRRIRSRSTLTQNGRLSRTDSSSNSLSNPTTGSQRSKGQSRPPATSDTLAQSLLTGNVQTGASSGTPNGSTPSGNGGNQRRTNTRRCLQGTFGVFSYQAKTSEPAAPSLDGRSMARHTKGKAKSKATSTTAPTEATQSTATSPGSQLPHGVSDNQNSELSHLPTAALQGEALELPLHCVPPAEFHPPSYTNAMGAPPTSDAVTCPPYATGYEPGCEPTLCETYACDSSEYKGLEIVPIPRRNVSLDAHVNPSPSEPHSSRDWKFPSARTRGSYLFSESTGTNYSADGSYAGQRRRYLEHVYGALQSNVNTPVTFHQEIRLRAPWNAWPQYSTNAPVPSLVPVEGSIGYSELATLPQGQQWNDARLQSGALLIVSDAQNQIFAPHPTHPPASQAVALASSVQDAVYPEDSENSLFDIPSNVPQNQSPTDGFSESPFLLHNQYRSAGDTPQVGLHALSGQGVVGPEYIDTRQFLASQLASHGTLSGASQPNPWGRQVSNVNVSCMGSLYHPHAGTRQALQELGHGALDDSRQGSFEGMGFSGASISPDEFVPYDGSENSSPEAITPLVETDEWALKSLKELPFSGEYSALESRNGQ